MVENFYSVGFGKVCQNEIRILLIVACFQKNKDKYEQSTMFENSMHQEMMPMRRVGHKFLVTFN